jgi:hypothetical protein
MHSGQFIISAPSAIARFAGSLIPQIVSLAVAFDQTP